MFEELPRDEVLACIDRSVTDLLSSAGIAAPPVDAIVLAQRHLGMTIVLDQNQPQRGRAQRAAGRKQIFLRPEPREERHQWTVAHEIGEHLKADLLRQLGVPPENTRVMAGESLANLFAYRLLVPTIWFSSDAPAFDYDIVELKNHYRSASHEVVAWRLLDLPEPCIITIVDNDAIHRRRSNAWRIRRRLEPAEQTCQRYVHHYSRSRQLQEAGWTVLGWPVHQADWKREILRSVIDIEALPIEDS